MSQVLDQLIVELRADIKGLQAGLTNAAGQVERFGRKAEKDISLVDQAFGRARTAALQFATVYGAFRVGKSIVEAGMQMQALQNRMIAATGDVRVAANAMGFAREQANRLGQDFRATADGFADFSASALRAGLTLDETKGIFTGVSEAAAALHLSSQRVELVFTALSQMASKGKVSMEELSQQLGDSLPGTLATFAKALGVSTAEFTKMISEGRVLVPDLIKLGNELHNQFGGRAVTAAQSAQAAFVKLGNAVFELQVKIANSGFLDVVVEGVRDLTDLLNDPKTQQGLAHFAELLSDIASKALSAASSIGTFYSKVNEGVENFGTGVFKTLFGDEGVKALEEARRRKAQFGDAGARMNNASDSPYKGNARLDAMLAGAETAGSGKVGKYTLGALSTPIESAAQKQAREKAARLRAQLSDMRAGLITEGDPNKVDAAKATAALNKRFAEEQTLLDKALKSKAITEQQYREDSLAMEVDYQARLADIRKQYRDAYISDEQAAAEGFLGIQLNTKDQTIREQAESFRDTISQAAQHNRTFFALEKTASIARALLAARESVVSAYNFGSRLGGPVLGAAFAGVAAAAQAANIAAIASTSFGGGGSVSSSGGSAAGGGGSDGSDSGGSATPIKEKNVYITLAGDDAASWSKNQVRKLIESINDALSDGSSFKIAVAA